MTHDPRPHIHRRRRAIDRLRSLTTGAAIAGIAGTAGFGVLAAATWSGDATAATTRVPTTTTDETTGQSGLGVVRPQVIPDDDGTVQQPVAVPRVKRGSGSGHASTGGSG